MALNLAMLIVSFVICFCVFLWAFFAQAQSAVAVAIGGGHRELPTNTAMAESVDMLKYYDALEVITRYSLAADEKNPTSKQVRLLEAELYLEEFKTKHL